MAALKAQSTCAWDTLAEPEVQIPDGVEVVAALDFARFHDEAALVWLWCRDGAPPLATARVWTSDGEDPIEYEAVMDAVRNLQRRYELRAVAYDPRLFDKAAEELAGEGAPMVQFDQTNARMCPASAELRRAILSDELRHYGDPTSPPTSRPA